MWVKSIVVLWMRICGSREEGNLHCNAYSRMYKCPEKYSPIFTFLLFYLIRFFFWSLCYIVLSFPVCITVQRIKVKYESCPVSCDHCCFHKHKDIASDLEYWNWSSKLKWQFTSEHPSGVLRYIDNMTQHFDCLLVKYYFTTVELSW